MNKLLRTYWRRELSYVCLAIMECCWLFPWASVVTGRQAGNPQLPFAALVSMLLLALYMTRLLELAAPSEGHQRLLTLFLALLSILLLVRLGVYAEYRPTDLTWLLRFVHELGNVLQRIPPALTVFALGLYLWWRGISLAQRELDVGSAGLSFRIGILAFLWLSAVGVFGARVETTALAFVYFALGLVVMGLARVHDVSQSQEGIRSPFNASWLGILGGAALLVSLLSLVAAWLLSLRTIAALVLWLTPVWRALGRLVSPLGVVLAWLLELVLSFLVRLFSGLLGASGKEPSAVDRIVQRLLALQPAPQAAVRAPLWLHVVKWIVLGLLLMGALGMLALSIRRGRRQRAGARSAEHGSLASTQSPDHKGDHGLQGRLLQLREGLLAALSRLRGQEYALVTIRQIYASLTRLAAIVGSPRREAQTPYEYVDDLQSAFPGSREEVQLITEAYVGAHYGERRFQPEYVQRVREAWLTIRERYEQARTA